MPTVVKLVVIASGVILVCAAAIIVAVLVIKLKRQNDLIAAQTTTLTTQIQSVTSSSTARQTSNTTTSQGTSRSSTTSPTTASQTNTTVTDPLISSSYSSALTTESPKFCRGVTCDGSNSYYYSTYSEVIRLNISVTGLYTIRSQSSMDTFGCLYNRSYEPTYYYINTVAINDDYNGDTQFQISIQLSADGTYVLVVTTYRQNVTGPFTIIITGPGPVGMTKIDPAAAATMVYSTSISSTLTNDSSRFCFFRDCSTPYYYYQSYTLNVTTNGLYAIQSYSDIDMAGLLENDTFIPSNYLLNLLNLNDNLAEHGQFFMTSTFSTSMRYILIITTGEINIFGSFTVIIKGPDYVTVTPYIPPLSDSQDTFQMLRQKS